MKKLQRYWAEESGIYGLTTDDCEVGETSRLVCKSADVSALEAELAEYAAREQLLRELANEWASFSWAPFMNPAVRLKATLSREQEKP